jgi:hypothetical protein
MQSQLLNSPPPEPRVVEVDVFGGKEKQFEMPDGNMVTVHNQIIRCPELMFRPVPLPLLPPTGPEAWRLTTWVGVQVMNNLEVKGLHELVHKTAMDCDGDVRKDLFGNIIMAGGSTMFPFMKATPRPPLNPKVASPWRAPYRCLTLPPTLNKYHISAPRQNTTRPTTRPTLI